MSEWRDISTAPRDGVFVLLQRTGEFLHRPRRSAHMDRRDLELRKFQREEELQHAIKQKIIEYGIAAKIKEDGYADSKICTQIEKCVTEECKQPLQPACERIRKRCDPTSKMGQTRASAAATMTSVLPP
jgi:hypothetical protein